MRLRDKVAVVTGGTKGLGSAIAERYLAEGARVVCAARGTSKIENLIERYPERAVYQPVDVSSGASVDELMELTSEAFGRIDVLVSCAGVNHDSRIERLSPVHWRQILETNLTGTYLCMRAAAPYLRRSTAGRIITVSSVLGTRPTLGAAAYCASKAGVEMLTRVGAQELAPTGIQVNCIAPGFINVGMGRDIETNEKLWPVYRRQIGLKRTGWPNEVADAAVFLAGPESTYVNGHVLEVSGGMSWA